MGEHKLANPHEHCSNIMLYIMSYDVILCQKLCHNMFSYVFIISRVSEETMGREDARRAKSRVARDGPRVIQPESAFFLSGAEIHVGNPVRNPHLNIWGY